MLPWVMIKWPLDEAIFQNIRLFYYVCLAKIMKMIALNVRRHTVHSIHIKSTPQKAREAKNDENGKKPSNRWSGERILKYEMIGSRIVQELSLFDSRWHFLSIHFLRGQVKPTFLESYTPSSSPLSFCFINAVNKHILYVSYLNSYEITFFKTHTRLMPLILVA